MHIDLHVRHKSFSSDLITLEFSRQIFEKYSDIKFHENPFSGGMICASGRTDRQTDRQRRT